MTDEILNWLLEDNTPEVKLRTLKEYLGLSDIGEELDKEVWNLIDTYGFQLMCGEPMLLRNLVKLGYYDEPVVKMR